MSHLQWLRQLLFRVRTLLYRERVVAELDDEMRAHRELIADELIAGGMAPRDATLAARKRFGNPLALRERSSAEWGVPMMEQLWQDLRYGLRLLARSPWFATVAITAIGLSIGVNAATFAFIDAFMLRPLPVANPQRLVKLLAVNARHTTSLGFSYSAYTTLATRARSLRDVVAYAAEPVALRAGPTAPASEASVGCVSPNYFSTLGGRAAVGRLLDSADALDAAAPVATISDAMWEREYQRHPDVVGQTVLVNGQRVTIIGVAQSSFIGINPLVPDLWMPLRTADRLGITPGRLTDDTNRFLVLHARVRGGYTREQAAAEVAPLVAEPLALAGSAAELTRIIGVELMPSESAVPANAESMLIVLPALLVVGLVLVIASANLGNMLLARALARQREIAIRLAIGASRGRLLRQLMTESVAIAAIGTIVGLIFASMAVALIVREGLSAVPATYGRITVGVGLSWRALVYCALLALISVLTFGLIPALQSSRRDPLAAMKGEDAAFGSGIKRSRFRSLLVAGQVGACVFVLIAAAILVHNLRAMAESPAGFDQTNTIVARLGLATAAHISDDAARDRAEFVRRVEQSRGITRVAQTSNPPYAAWPVMHVAPVGTTEGLTGFPFARVTPSYFETIGMRMLEGVGFTAQDTIGGSRVAIVSAATGRRLWPHGSAVGQMIRVASPDGRADSLVRVIGVVSDARNQSPRESIDDGYIYLPATSTDFATLPMSFVIKVNQPTATMIPALQRIAFAIDGAQPLSITPMQELAARQVLPMRYVAVSAAGVGTLAVLLALVGLYGVVSFIVTQRRRDIAVHMALGATTRQIMKLVLREQRAVGIGLAIGTASSIGLVPLLSSMTLQLSPLPVASFVAIVGAMAVVALLATMLPARRALRVGAMEVLRHD